MMPARVWVVTKAGAIVVVFSVQTDAEEFAEAASRDSNEAYVVTGVRVRRGYP
jgi:hypothetical protein